MKIQILTANQNPLDFKENKTLLSVGVDSNIFIHIVIFIVIVCLNT